MWVEVFDLAFVAFVRTWCKPSQTFVIDVYSEWIDACQKDINSQIKFVVVNKQWIIDVPAYHALIDIPLQVTQIRNNVDSFALWTLRWLVDPQVVFLNAVERLVARLFCLFYLLFYLIESLLEQRNFIRVLVRLRNEFEVVCSKFRFQVQQIFCKPIFASELNRVHKMVDFLVFK